MLFNFGITNLQPFNLNCKSKAMNNILIMLHQHQQHASGMHVCVHMFVCARIFVWFDLLNGGIQWAAVLLPSLNGASSAAECYSMSINPFSLYHLLSDYSSHNNSLAYKYDLSVTSSLAHNVSPVISALWMLLGVVWKVSWVNEWEYLMTSLMFSVRIVFFFFCCKQFSLTLVLDSEVTVC